jgi:hypothetical protein
MTAFRAFLAMIWLVIAVYTVNVVAAHGLNLLPIFFGDMAQMEWPGQFNLDFMFMLTLSGLWVAWRHRFSAAGLVLGLLAFSFGAFFLSAYLLVMSFRAKGNMKEVLLGKARGAE